MADDEAKGKPHHGSKDHLTDSELHKYLDSLLSATFDHMTHRPGAVDAFQSACRHGDLRTVKYLLKNGMTPNHCAHDGTFPLYHAAANGHEEIIRLLMDNKARINLQTVDIKWTALMAATYWGHLSTVQLLVAYGADLRLRNSEHKTALHLAVQMGHEPLIEYLKKKLLLNLRR